MKRVLTFIFFIVNSSLFISCPAQTVINYSYEPAVQHFNVPPGVSTITVSIGGAQGGGTLGGKGASFTGICNVVSPHILSVVVGQQGGVVGWQGGDTNGGGGGGASWVYDSNAVLYNPSSLNRPLAVAAGGGGSGYYVVFGGLNQWTFYPGYPGGVEMNTNEATGGIYNDSVGREGNGGGGGLYGSGGAGWLTNGGGGYCSAGIDEANDFARPITNSYCDTLYVLYPGLFMGFGGGGVGGFYNLAGHDGVNGGGGGGYNGGGAGYGGGGGGSYLNGTLVGVAIASDTGNGFVSISYFPPLSQVIDIYPNPNSGVFTVNGVRQEQIIEIYNCLGQKLQTLQANNTFVQIDLSTYANGVYMVEVRNADGSQAWQTKVVKIP